MKVAILSAGSSLRDFLPFNPAPFDVVVAVNDAATLAPWHHWAAFDKPLSAFQAKFPEWERVDWGPEFLEANSPTFPRGPRYTLPMTLEAVQQVYKPTQIHCFGVDMSGERLDGEVCKAGRWAIEEEHLRRLDLSRVQWFGKWRP
jgi:hypothetical protein